VNLSTADHWAFNHSARRRAELSPEVQSWAEEVALDEQGHVRMVRQVRLDTSWSAMHLLPQSDAASIPLMLCDAPLTVPHVLCVQC
jgi:hypothetical protein